VCHYSRYCDFKEIYFQRILYRRTACICSFEGNNSHNVMSEIKMNVVAVNSISCEVDAVKTYKLPLTIFISRNIFRLFVVFEYWFSDLKNSEWDLGIEPRTKKYRPIRFPGCSKYVYTPYAMSFRLIRYTSLRKRVIIFLDLD
jgi:hypothetical protein